MPPTMRATSLSLLLIPLLCCSCSMLLVNTVPTQVGAALSPGGGHRQDLIAQLGQPVRTTAEPIPVHVPRNLSSTNAVCICDHYRISGLVQVQDEPYASDWRVYPVLVIL